MAQESGNLPKWLNVFVAVAIILSAIIAGVALVLPLNKGSSVTQITNGNNSPAINKAGDIRVGQ